MCTPRTFTIYINPLLTTLKNTQVSNFVLYRCARIGHSIYKFLCFLRCDLNVNEGCSQKIAVC